MADDGPTAPKGDAATATATGVIGQSPALAMAMVYQAAAQATAQTLQNQVTAQQGLQQVNMAVVSSAISRILAASQHPVSAVPPAPPAPPPAPPPRAAAPDDDLRSEVASLRSELAKTKQQLARLLAAMERSDGS